MVGATEACFDFVVPQQAPLGSYAYWIDGIETSPLKVEEERPGTLICGVIPPRDYHGLDEFFPFEYFDRFGNGYFKHEIESAQYLRFGGSQCDEIEDFILLFDETIFTQNEKIVNEIYLTTAAAGNYSLTDEQFDLIRPIAEQCSMEGGKVVYRARALYQLRESRKFEEICEPFQALQGAASNRTASFIGTPLSKIKYDDKIKVYPNPTKAFLQIEFPPVLLDKNIHIVLNNIQGQPIQSWSNANNNLQRLDIKNIPAGIYWLSISTNGENILHRRVVILP